MNDSSGFHDHDRPDDDSTRLDIPKSYHDSPTTPYQPSAEHRSHDLIEIAGYEVVETLGRGGMGIVYKARDLRLNRLVALKMILSGVHATDEQLARFHQEAQTAASLQHPNIVHVYEVGEQNGFSYLTLEYVDGTTLAKYANGNPQSARFSAEMIELLARAMEYAHQQGIVHRDLKLGNVLLANAPARKTSNRGGDESSELPITSEGNQQSEKRTGFVLVHDSR